ncbi:transposase [Algoriphagus sp. PAP.12]|uniref:transposase n=1 Tax=Algoriphagus sp. PAP.12 TaxID=2996678 RepID=UPI00227ADEEB|nr:ArdC-like ssDNA-binding domain-containing protein [Algoriphagus sp. PAP.12]
MKTAVIKSGNGKRRSTVYGKQNNKLDRYERFTQLILEKLEQGVVPWRKPWNSLGLPSNYLTKKPYQGPNPHKRVNKNTPKDIDLNLRSYQMFEGTDLLAIEGMSYSTILALMSEVGLERIRFKTAKHFASWLRLAPNNKISGGKLLSSKVPKGSNRLKIALRNAPNAIRNLKDSTPLRDFFHRINFRKGRVAAISATARKLAVIFWNLVVKGVRYINPEGYLFLDQKRKLGLVKRIKKQINKFGLTEDDLGLKTVDF